MEWGSGGGAWWWWTGLDGRQAHGDVLLANTTQQKQQRGKAKSATQCKRTLVRPTSSRTAQPPCLPRVCSHASVHVHCHKQAHGGRGMATQQQQQQLAGARWLTAAAATAVQGADRVAQRHQEGRGVRARFAAMGARVSLLVLRCRVAVSVRAASVRSRPGQVRPAPPWGSTGH